MKYAKLALATVLATMAFETATFAADVPKALVKAARCQSLLLAQAKAYTALTTLLDGSAPVVLDPGTRQSIVTISKSFSRFGDASLRRAEVLDTFALDRAPGDGYDAYKRSVDTQSRNFFTSIAKAVVSPVPNSGVVNDLSKETMECTNWVDTEVHLSMMK